MCGKLQLKYNSQELFNCKQIFSAELLFIEHRTPPYPPPPPSLYDPARDQNTLKPAISYQIYPGLAGCLAGNKKQKCPVTSTDVQGRNWVLCWSWMGIIKGTKTDQVCRNQRVHSGSLEAKHFTLTVNNSVLPDLLASLMSLRSLIKAVLWKFLSLKLSGLSYKTSFVLIFQPKTGDSDRFL